MKTNGTVPAAPRIVFVPGAFSMLHRGHLNLLHRARALGNVLVVGVVSDGGVRAYKGRLPVDALGTRMDAVRRLSFVDVVVRQETTDPTPLLERFRPDVVAHADGDSDWSVLRERVERLGIEYVALPYTPDISTTLLRAVHEHGPEGEPGWDGASA